MISTRPAASARRMSSAVCSRSALLKPPRRHPGIYFDVEACGNAGGLCCLDCFLRRPPGADGDIEVRKNRGRQACTCAVDPGEYRSIPELFFSARGLRIIGHTQVVHPLIRERSTDLVEAVSVAVGFDDRGNLRVCFVSQEPIVGTQGTEAQRRP